MSHINIYLISYLIGLLQVSISTTRNNHQWQVHEKSSRLKFGSLMRSTTSSPSMRPMRSWPPKGHDENDWFQRFWQVWKLLDAFRFFLEMIQALFLPDVFWWRTGSSQNASIAVKVWPFSLTALPFETQHGTWILGLKWLASCNFHYPWSPGPAYDLPLVRR